MRVVVRSPRGYLVLEVLAGGRYRSRPVVASGHSSFMVEGDLAEVVTRGKKWPTEAQAMQAAGPRAQRWRHLDFVSQA